MLEAKGWKSLTVSYSVHCSYCFWAGLLCKAYRVEVASLQLFAQKQMEFEGFGL